MFDSHGKIDLKTVPSKHEYTSGDGQIQFSGAKHWFKDKPILIFKVII